MIKPNLEDSKQEQALEEERNPLILSNSVSSLIIISTDQIDSDILTYLKSNI